jgi:excisionase family DNA binding protein
MTKLFYNVDELAATIGVKVPTIRLWTCYGDIPRTKMGRLVRFKLEDVLAWIQQGGPQRIKRKAGQTETEAK